MLRFSPRSRPFHGPALLLAGAAALLLSACQTPPGSTAIPPDAPPLAGIGAATPGQPPAASQAHTPKAYRQDAARHLYALNTPRIYKGQLPPMLYAVGVLEVDVDRNGRVGKLHWMRAPKHAPEVMREIERTVRAAAPFPVPTRMGRVTYTDVWLWDESGRFQLDSLTEGQLQN
jgi:protein TonB